MRQSILFTILLSTSLIISGIADPRDKATAERAEKLRGDFRVALKYSCPKLGLDDSATSNILANLDSMVPREGLLNPWRKSNSWLSKLGIIDKDEFPSMIEMREGILIVQKAPFGENISLTAFYANEVTDQEAEYDAVKDSKDVAKNSKWAYRFVFRSRIKAGYSSDVTTVKPVFLLKYTDQIPVHFRVYNDSMVYVMGECKIKKLEVVARENGVFKAENLTVKELIVDQRDDTVVELAGKAGTMDAVVDDKATMLTGDLLANEINMNLSRNDCKQVEVNPQQRLITIGNLETGTFKNLNQKIRAEDGSVVWRNVKNMGRRIKRATSVSVKGIVFGTGYVSWQIIKLPFKFLGAIGKRLKNAKVGVGGSVGVGPVRVGGGVLI